MDMHESLNRRLRHRQPGNSHWAKDPEDKVPHPGVYPSQCPLCKAAREVAATDAPTG